PSNQTSEERAWSPPCRAAALAAHLPKEDQPCGYMENATLSSQATSQTGGWGEQCRRPRTLCLQQTASQQLAWELR
ncbi:MAG: hypothetical protein BJ554DRAFT_2963, partial [Olpidium bornovanus]